jgi:hypothetical protein
MTLDECTDLLEPLAIAMRVQMDVPTYVAYHAILRDVPLELAMLGLEQWRQAGPRFFPTAPEIQSFAEKARRQQLASHPWEPCGMCADTQPGWRTVIAGGVERVQPCPCKSEHRRLLQARGLLEPIAVLPGEAGVGENEQVYPRFEQLPAKLQKELKPLINQKVLR